MGSAAVLFRLFKTLETKEIQLKKEMNTRECSLSCRSHSNVRIDLQTLTIQPVPV